MSEPIFHLSIGQAPPRETWGNAEVNGFQRSRVRKQWRADIAEYMRVATIDSDASFERVFVAITILWPPRQRRLDDDNAIRAVKSVRDEIAKQLGVDDRNWMTAWVTQGRSADMGGWTIVELYAERPNEHLIEVAA